MLSSTLHPAIQLPCSNFKGSAAYVRSFLRKGRALLGLGCSRDAAAAFDAGDARRCPGRLHA